MKFEESLQFVQKELRESLILFFTAKRLESQKIHPQSAQLVDAVTSFTLGGGKRMRPFLCWAGYHMAFSSQLSADSKKIPMGLLRAMMGIELLQSFALIHDDIIDGDSQRRGSPTVHKVFSSQLSAESSQQKRKHFGESMAILAGDLALSWADSCIEKVGERSVSAIYQQTKQELILGQSLDVLKEQAHVSIDKTITDTYKTAYYSIVRPLQIGFLVGNGQEPELSKIETFGLSLGRAFQLRDDYLDGDVAESEFYRQSDGLVLQSSKALDNLDANPAVKQLLADFVQFVVTRQS